MTDLSMIPLSKLRYGRDVKDGSIDSRRTEAGILSLMNSIKAHGLLVPLLIRVADNDSFDVIDGNRRLEALRQIHGKASTEKVACAVKLQEGEDALELSMVCNVEREGLHPVDRFEVFATLVQNGTTVEDIAKRYGLKVPHVRQALALGKMAPEVRDAWREGKLDAEVAEAFTTTSDHKAQVAALKKAGKHPTTWEVRRALAGDDHYSMGTLLKIVGAANYEKAGYQINTKLFADDGERDNFVVSDLPALKAMVAERIDGYCAELKAAGWKWAIDKSEAPQDVYAWRRIHAERGKYTKEAMATMGCLVSIVNDTLYAECGVVKPGDSVKLPKSKTEKKAETKEREKRKKETGGISNALAERLSKQLTGAFREAIAEGAGSESLPLAIAALASSYSPFQITVRTRDDGDDNDFSKYLKMVSKKSLAEQSKLLALWLAKSIDLRVSNGKALNALLFPMPGDDTATALICECIVTKVLEKAIAKHFDAEDYFNSVSRDLILEAVKDVKKENLAACSRMTASELRVWAIRNIKGWVPKQFRVA